MCHPSDDFLDPRNGLQYFVNTPALCRIHLVGQELDIFHDDSQRIVDLVRGRRGQAGDIPEDVQFRDGRFGLLPGRASRTKCPDSHAIPTVTIGRHTSRHVLQDRPMQVLMSVQNCSPLVIYASWSLFKIAHSSVSTRRVVSVDSYDR